MKHHKPNPESNKHKDNVKRNLVYINNSIEQ